MKQNKRQNRQKYGEKEHYSSTNYDKKCIKTNLIMWKHCTLFMSYNLAIEKLAIEDQRKQKSTYRKTKY